MRYELRPDGEHDGGSQGNGPAPLSEEELLARLMSEFGAEEIFDDDREEKS